MLGQKAPLVWALGMGSWHRGAHFSFGQNTVSGRNILGVHSLQVQQTLGSHPLHPAIWNLEIAGSSELGLQLPFGTRSVLHGPKDAL